MKLLLGSRLPPAPGGATISYGPGRLAGASGIQ